MKLKLVLKNGNAVKKMFSLLLIGFLFAACQSEKGDGLSGTELKISAAISSDETTGTQTRAVKKVFEQGDEIGIFAVKRISANVKAYPTSAGNYVTNAKWICQADGTFAPASESDKIIITNVPMDVYAYYPYNIDANDPTNISQLKVDPSQGILTAREVIAKIQNITLPFKHKLALIEVSVTGKGEGAILNHCLSASFYSNKGQYAALDLSKTDAGDELLTSSKAGLVPMQRVESIAKNPTTYTFQTMVAPQKITKGDRLLQFEQNTVSYSKVADVDCTVGESSVNGFAVTIDQEVEANHVYAVGDYYPYKGFPVGIVFEVNNGGKNGKIFSVEQTGGFWRSRGYDSKAEAYEGTSDASDGANNFEIIKKHSNWAMLYPAFAWCASKGDGWYLPAKDELRGVFNLYISDCQGLDAKLKTIGGDEFKTGTSYWTSTEHIGIGDFPYYYAYTIHFPSGILNTASLKCNDDYVIRAVRKF